MFVDTDIFINNQAFKNFIELRDRVTCKGFEITACGFEGRGYVDRFLTTATVEIIVRKLEFFES